MTPLRDIHDWPVYDWGPKAREVRNYLWDGVRWNRRPWGMISEVIWATIWEEQLAEMEE